MNKQKFVEYLRSPEEVSASQFEEIEQLLVDYPYFSIAKSVAARASKNLDRSNKDQLISSAAIYATDRKHLKKYVNGEVIFLADTPSIETVESKEEAKTEETPKTEESPKTPETKTDSSESSILPESMKAANSDVDQILDELQRDMDALKKSRLHFAEIQGLIDDGSEAVRAPYKPKEIKPISEPEKPKIEATESKEDVAEEVSEVQSKEDTIEEIEEVQSEESSVEEIEEATSKEEVENVEDSVEKTEEPTPKEEPATAKSEKTDSNSISSLIDSLKKEFAEEEEEDEKAESKSIQKTEPEETKVESKSEDTKPKEELKSEESEKPTSDEVKEVIEAGSEETEEAESIPAIKEEKKPEPPSKGKNTVVTNMDDDEDDDEEDTVLDPKDKPVGEAPTKKLSARETRGSRQKVSREDMEKMMGITFTPSTKKPASKAKETEKEESTEQEEVPEKKPAAKKKTTSKKKPTKKDEPQEKETKTEKPKAIVEPKEDEGQNAPEAAEKPKEEEVKEEPKAETPPADDQGEIRSSARAFMDFGGTGNMSSSVSRASSSRRKKRTNRPPKPDGDSSEKSGGDSDDKPGPQDLIDKFIETNPSIQRRNLGNDKTDLAEKSSQWQSDVASEYLAEIYLGQGNKKRAIQIYEALILKFPEKKSYFAALIEKVQA